MQHVFDRVSVRAREIFESDGRQTGSDLQNWYRAESELLCPIQADVFETDSAFTVRAEVPDFRADELEIALERRRFIIAGERKSENARRKNKPHARQSQNYLFHSGELPQEVDVGNAKAHLQAGILRLELAKRATQQKALTAAAGAGAP